MKKIIVAEDNLAMSRLISIELSRNGFETTFVNSGKEVIDVCLKNPETLLLLDYILPDLTCNQIIDSIKLQNPNLNFIVMSGRGNEKIAVEMIKKGALNYIPKHIDFIEILTPILNKAIQEIELKNEIQKIDSLYKQSEIKYRQIVDNTESLILSVNKNKEIIFTNNKLFEYLGYSEFEIIGKNIDLILHPDYINLCDSVFEELFLETDKLKFHTQYLQKNGNAIDAEVKASIVKNNKNKSHIVLIIDDITDRKFEQELLMNHSITASKLNKISNLNEAAEFLCKRISEIKDVEFVRLLHKKKNSEHFEELFSQNITSETTEQIKKIISENIIQIDHKNSVFSIISNKIISEAKCNHIIIYDIKKSKHIIGKIYFGFKNIESFTNNVKREIESLLQHTGDALTRIEAEQELHEFSESQIALKDIISLTLENDNLTVFFDKIFSKLFTLDWLKIEKKGSVLFIDEKSNKLKIYYKRGIPESLVCVKNGVNIGQCLCGKSFKTNETIVRSCMNGEHSTRSNNDSKHGHIIVPIKNNKQTFGLINLYLQHNRFPSEREVSFVESVADILSNYIEKHHSNEKIILLSKKLLSRNNELKQLISITTHELRAPLVNIDGFHKEIIKTTNNNIESLSSDNKTKIFKYSNIINSNLNKMNEMLKSIRDLHQLNIFEIDLENIDMNLLMQECIQTFKNEIDKYKIKINLQKLSNINADKNLVLKVFLNLFENSIKYRNEKNNFTISIKSTTGKEYRTFYFKDNGIGINAVALRRIFDLFHKNEILFKGTGLGLPYVKKVMDLHNGKILIESVEGHGTTVTIKFPIVV